MTDDWLKKHQQRRAELDFAIKDPWNDKMCYKTGLCETYICSTITEILHISAELDPHGKLNTPNPIYHKLVDMICSLLKTKNKSKHEDYLIEFRRLVDYVGKLTELKGDVFTAWPYKLGDVDIRALDTIEECLIFLFTFFTGQHA